MSTDDKVKAPLPIASLPPIYIRLLFTVALPRYAREPLPAGEVQLPEREARRVLVASSFLGILSHTDKLRMDHDLVRTDLLKALSSVHELDAGDIAGIATLIDSFEYFRIAPTGHPQGAWITEAWWRRYQTAEYRYPSVFSCLVEQALSFSQNLQKTGALASPPAEGFVRSVPGGGNAPGDVTRDAGKVKASVARLLPSMVPEFLKGGVPGYAETDLIQGEVRLPPAEVRGVIIAATLIGALAQTKVLGMKHEPVNTMLLKSLHFIEGVVQGDVERAVALVDRFENYEIIRTDHPFEDWITEAWWPQYQVVPYCYPSALSNVVEYALRICKMITDNCIVTT